MRGCSTDGGIAQLGERLNGIQEVSGSIPLISTTKEAWETRFFHASFIFKIRSCCQNKFCIGLLPRGMAAYGRPVPKARQTADARNVPRDDPSA